MSDRGYGEDMEERKSNNLKGCACIGILFLLTRGGEMNTELYKLVENSQIGWFSYDVYYRGICVAQYLDREMAQFHIGKDWR